MVLWCIVLEVIFRFSVVVLCLIGLIEWIMYICLGVLIVCSVKGCVYYCCMCVMNVLCLLCDIGLMKLKLYMLGKLCGRLCVSIVWWNLFGVGWCCIVSIVLCRLFRL